VSLTSGARRGSYELTAQIVVGGMSEVYRDTGLDRAVAVRIGIVHRDLEPGASGR